MVNSATHLARNLVLQLISHGVKEVIASPGSRNAPLSIALFAAHKAKLLTLHTRIDERTAGFFALGITKASRSPVAVVCTSGTAAANYHPAVLEAHHCEIPLIIITADRPARLRGSGANQTTMQDGLYSGATRFSADISDTNFDFAPAFLALHTGPIHLNVQFDEPLLSDDQDDWLRQVQSANFVTCARRSRERYEVDTARGLILIGHDRAGFSLEEIDKFAQQVGWPVVAEDPLSFPGSIAHASLFLTSENTRKVLSPDSVIVIGRTTLSRSINALVKSSKNEVVIDPRMERVDIRRSANHTFLSLPEIKNKLKADPQWHGIWKSYSQKASSAIAVLPGWSEANIAKTIAQGLPDLCSLYISSSRPIRDLEAFATPRSGVETFANRGLAGIDGNISTALGIASQRKSTYAILGDLSFLHDLTGLIGGADIDLRILIINNDGGGIFSTLPQAGVAGFEMIFATPHGLAPETIALAMGIPAVRVTTMDQLVMEMFAPIKGLSLVIAYVPERAENAKMLKNITLAML